MSRLLDILSGGTGLSETDILSIARNAPIRYKNYKIKKKNGKMREISQPARELKALQRVLVSELLDNLPIHQCATAYRTGVSIRENATRHAENGPILKFDFENFFPSIKASDWLYFCQENNVFDNTFDANLSTRLFFHRPKGTSILRLAVGAPSSPSLSNVLMRSFDEQVCDTVAVNQVTYTRYADDLTFSAKRTGFLTGVERDIRHIIHNLKSPSLKLNESKTVLATKKYKRVVTGLVLSNDGEISIGHQKKRLIRSMVHHASQGSLDLNEQAHLSGLLAFIHDVEPEFLNRLNDKYGSDLIEQIKAVRKPPKRF